MFNSEDFVELKEIIETTQGVKMSEIKRYGSVSFNTYRILTSEERDAGEDQNKPNMVFKIANNCFYLTNMYMLHEKRGTGVMIIEWIIDFCRKKNLKELIIGKSKNPVVWHICSSEKFNFNMKNCYDDGTDRSYSLKF